MSLYNIEQDILELFALIEENDGEMTEEQANLLDITKDNLKQKLDNYYKAIKSFQGDVLSAKEEIKRLQSNFKTKENRVDRLKKAILTAVELFGDSGKTNKFIETSTVRFFTKTTPSVSVDDARISLLIREFESYILQLVNSGVLYVNQDVDLQLILDIINTNIKYKHDNADFESLGMDATSEFIPYTLSDLITLKLNISTRMTIYEMFRKGENVLRHYAQNPFSTKIENSTMKEDWKVAIETADKINNIPVPEDDEFVKHSSPTVAKSVKNTSIQMK